MREIVFSKLNPEKVARTMDNFLDLRDGYLFATLFNGCMKGYISGAEFERIRKLRKEPIRNAVFCTFGTWLIIVVLKIILFPVEPAEAIIEALYIVAGCALIYLIFMSSRSISFRNIRVDRSADRQMAEACGGLDQHILSRPVFYGSAVIRAKKQIRAAGKDEQRAEEQRMAEVLYGYVCELYNVWQLVTISKEIREFADQCGIEFVECELKEKWGKDINQVYQIMITAKFPEAEDTVIPMETDEKTRTFALPFSVGEAIKSKYGRKKRMDLSVLDDSYYEFKREFGKAKSEIMGTMHKKKPEEKAAVKNAMDLVRF